MRDLLQLNGSDRVDDPGEGPSGSRSYPMRHEIFSPSRERMTGDDDVIQFREEDDEVSNDEAPIGEGGISVAAVLAAEENLDTDSHIAYLQEPYEGVDVQVHQEDQEGAKDEEIDIPLKVRPIADDSGEDSDDDDVKGAGDLGAYNPADYEHLAVSGEIKELFQLITRYTPQTIDLEHRLKPFIPDYIPAVGDIDAFIKIPRPDGAADTLGLTILDEPALKQSDPTVLDLTLRAVAKQSSAKAIAVKSIDDAEKNPKAIEKWIKDISDLHRSKPPPTVHYTKQMPDIDSLMQEWPGEFEDLLREVGLPTADLDCSLSEYTDIVCSLLDIPVYKSRVQSLHVLFTLYSAFKQSQHFQTFGQDKVIEEPDHLVIDN